MENNITIINKNIFDKAIELADNNFNELKPTLPYIHCDLLIINEKKQTFWFSNKETVEQHTKKL